MKQQNFETGKLGEEIARKHLKSKDFKIITSNFKTKFGEIDIIAAKTKILVFVEVKLKIGEDFGTPEEMVNGIKIHQVQSTAIAFLQQNPQIDNQYDGYRIDAVCIVLDQNRKVTRINHYENLTF